jgi:hypothetical protein
VGDLVEQPARHARREHGVAGGDRLDGADELLRAGVLEQEPARARTQRLDDVVVEPERREDQDAVAGQPARRLDAVEHRHADVHQHDVRPVRLGQADGLLAVARLGDDRDRAGRLEHGLEARAHQRLVIGDEDADHGAASG